MATDGFRFSFGDSAEPASEEVAGTRWGEPTQAIGSFPSYQLSKALLQTWGQAYPQEGTSLSHDASARRSKEPTAARPLELRLQTSTTPCVEFILCYQSAVEVDGLTNVSSSTASDDRRDIVPGQYYGGLKVWSCAADLSSYLVQQADIWMEWMADGATGPRRVMEIGCGQGLPGLTSLCLGAPLVTFQDYNAEVLELCVKGNVAATRVANAASTVSLPEQTVTLVHGDWVDFHCSSQSASPEWYDLVLGSDVTFDEEACEKAALLLSRCLRPGVGMALIASKLYYFGTNGGSLEFTKAASKYGMQVRTDAVMGDGAEGMKRVILRVTWLDH